MKKLLSKWFNNILAFDETGPIKKEFSIIDPTAAQPDGLRTVILAVSPSDGNSPTMVSLYFDSGVKLFEKKYQDDQDAQTEMSAMAQDLEEAATLSKEGKNQEAKNLVASLFDKYKRSSDPLVNEQPTPTMTQASQEPLQYKGWKISKFPEGGYIAEYDVMSLRADSLDVLKGKIDSKVRQAMGRKLKAGITMQNLFFDTVEEAMDFQKQTKELQGPEGAEEGKPLWEQMSGEEVAPSNESTEPEEDTSLAPPSLSYDRLQKDKAKTDKDIGKRIKEQVKTEVESALEQKSASVFGKDQEELVEALRKNGRNWDEIKKIFVKELSYNEDDTTVFLDSIRQKEEGPSEGLPLPPKPPTDLVSPETHDKLVKEVEDKKEPEHNFMTRDELKSFSPKPLEDEIARADNSEIRKVAGKYPCPKCKSKNTTGGEYEQNYRLKCNDCGREGMRGMTPAEDASWEARRKHEFGSKNVSLNKSAINPLQEPPAVGQAPGQPMAAPVEENPTFDSPVSPSQDTNPEPEFLEAPKEGDRIYVMGDYETGEDGYEGTMVSTYTSKGDEYAVISKDDGDNAEVALHRVVKASQKKVAKAYYEKKASTFLVKYEDHLGNRKHDEIFRNVTLEEARERAKRTSEHFTIQQVRDNFEASVKQAGPVYCKHEGCNRKGVWSRPSGYWCDKHLSEGEAKDLEQRKTSAHEHIFEKKPSGIEVCPCGRFRFSEEYIKEHGGPITEKKADVTDYSRGRNWKVIYYDKNNKVISSHIIKDRTESEASKEAQGDMPSNCEDWSMMPINTKKAAVSCPKCGEEIWDYAKGHKLNKCWNCGTAFDSPEPEMEVESDLEVESKSNQDVIRVFVDNSFPKDKMPVWGTENLKITKYPNGWALVNYQTPILYRDNGSDIIYFNTQKYSVTTSKIQTYIRRAFTGQNVKETDERGIWDAIQRAKSNVTKELNPSVKDLPLEHSNPADFVGIPEVESSLEFLHESALKLKAELEKEADDVGESSLLAIYKLYKMVTDYNEASQDWSGETRDFAGIDKGEIHVNTMEEALAKVKKIYGMDFEPVPDEPGRFDWNQTENANGYEDPNGKYLADYSVYIKLYKEHTASQLEREGEIAFYFTKEGIEKTASDDSAFEANGWCRVWVDDLEIEVNAKYPEILKIADENARIVALKDLAREIAHEALMDADQAAGKFGVQAWFESLEPSRHDRIDWVALANPKSEEEEDLEFEREQYRKYGPEAVSPEFRDQILREQQSAQNPKVEKKATHGTNFQDSDLGLWIDAAFGEEHRRAKLSDMVRPFNSFLADELNGPAPDDYSDEYDAIALLQEHTNPGLVWILEAGDLILTEESQLNAHKKSKIKKQADRLRCPKCGIPTIEDSPAAENMSEEEKLCNVCAEKLEKKAADPIPPAEGPKEVPTTFKKHLKAPPATEREKALPATIEQAQLVKDVESSLSSLEAIKSLVDQAKAKLNAEIKAIEERGGRVQIEGELKEKIEKLSKLVEAVQNQMIYAGDTMVRLVQETKERPFRPSDKQKVEWLTTRLNKYEDAAKYLKQAEDGAQHLATTEDTRELYFFPRKLSKLHKSAGFIETLDSIYNSVLEALKLIVGSGQESSAAV